jgi:endo-1,4-beta-xylanase
MWFLLNLKMFVIFLILFAYEALSQPLASGHSKFLGNVDGNSGPTANWSTYWNQITPENAGKWEYNEPSRGNYSWGGLDAAYNYAKQRGIPIRLHTLVWGQQYPGWIGSASLDTIAVAIEERIKIIGERYPDMDFVDVVNEPLHAYTNSADWPYAAKIKDALGGNGSTGWDWVIRAFEMARQYMPNAKLHLLDYNLLRSSTNANTIIQIVNLLQERNLIDGVCEQAHRMFIEDVTSETIKSNLNLLATTGLPIYINEFDLGNSGNAGTPNDDQQLQYYQRIFPILWEHHAVKGITIWGYIQGTVWQTSTYLVLTDGSERPAMIWLRNYLSKGNYRTHQSGNWDDVSTWEKHDGTTWIHPAPSIPTLASGPITILNGDTVNVSTSDSTNQLTIATGGTLAINSGVVLYVNDTIGTGMLVNGTVRNSGVLSSDTSIIIKFIEGGKYLHDQDGGIIPIVTWGFGSTCEIIGVTSSIPINVVQNFYNFTWNCSNQSVDLNVGWKSDATIAGTLTVTNSNWDHVSIDNPSYMFSLFGESGSYIVNNIVVNGYNAIFTAGNADTVTVNGNITISNGGMFSLSNNSDSITTFYVKGNITVIDSAYIGKSNSANNSKFVFCKSGTQNFVIPSTGVIFYGAPNIVVSSGSILNIGTSMFGGTGSFQIQSGATLQTGHIDGIDGNIKCTGTYGGENSLSTSANYIFNGSVAQTTGNLLPNTVNNLSINNNEGVTLSNTLIVDGTLDLQKGALSLGNNVLSYGTKGTLKYSGSTTQTTSDAEFPSLSGPKNLIISNASNVTLHASRTVETIILMRKLNIGANTLTADSIYNTTVSQFVLMSSGGFLRLTSVGLSQKLFPVGTIAYAPVWITNSGTIDTIGVGVADDAAQAAYGGRVKVKWTISESAEGGGNYRLQFGWWGSLEDNMFRLNRTHNAHIFWMGDTTEAGLGDYTVQFSAPPYSISRDGLTTLGQFAIGRFKDVPDIVKVEHSNGVVSSKFYLCQNYPNPFNPSTTIEFSLPVQSTVHLVLINMLGQVVKEIVHRDFDSGINKVTFNSSNLATGVYYYRLQAGNFVDIKKLVHIK